MTDLTEQWKKGELPSGWYYVKCLCENEDRIDYYNASFGCWTSNGKYIKQVLAPVPSYEELENMNKAVNECMAANIKLVEQNAKLKELLKECKMPLEVFADKKPACEWYPEDLLTRIDEVLK